MTRVPIQGDRAVTATLDDPDDAAACVVACPPHPEHGGSRSDRRLRAVSDALGERAIACLRFDYGPWDGGHGERRDADAALGWAGERYDHLGLFGYSFGGAVALVAAADRPHLAAVAALAPAAELGGEGGAASESGGDGTTDVADAVGRVAVPALVVYGERDTTVDAERVGERARAAGHAVEGVPADHHFVGQDRAVAGRVGEFFGEHCRSG